MTQTLQQRQREYESINDHKIIGKIPVVIKIDGWSFTRLTKNTSKPFCHKTMALMNDTMLSLVKQVDGVVFGYQYSDKIILITRNDQSLDTDSWFGNNIQDISTAASSICTYEFMNHLWNMKDGPDLQGPITFRTKTFGLPSIEEVVNYLIYRQYKCIQSAVNDTAISLLRPKYGKDTHSILENKNIEERKQIILDSGVDFSELPIAYRYGTAAYYIPRLVETSSGSIHNHKWTLDVDLSLFTEIKDKLRTILITGSDILRPERDLNGTI